VVFDGYQPGAHLKSPNSSFIASISIT